METCTSIFDMPQSSIPRWSAPYRTPVTAVLCSSCAFVLLVLQLQGSLETVVLDYNQSVTNNIKGLSARDSAPINYSRAIWSDILTDKANVCTFLEDLYLNFTAGSICPEDRHVVEELTFNPECDMPMARRCFVAIPRNYLGAKDRSNLSWDQALLRSMKQNVRYEAFPMINSFAEVQQASDLGVLPGKYEPDGGKDWGARVWRVGQLARIYEEKLRALERYIPFARNYGVANHQRSIRLVLDVGGGGGGFASALRRLYGLTCVTLTRDNSIPDIKHYFDLPFYEMLVEDGLPTIMWSGSRRLPVPDHSYDWINSEYAVENFSDDLEDFEKIFFEWDRILRPDGYISLTASSLDARCSGLTQFLRDFASKAGWQERVWSGSLPQKPEHPIYILQKSNWKAL